MPLCTNRNRKEKRRKKKQKTKNKQKKKKKQQKCLFKKKERKKKKKKENTTELFGWVLHSSDPTCNILFSSAVVGCRLSFSNGRFFQT